MPKIISIILVLILGFASANATSGHPEPKGISRHVISESHPGQVAGIMGDFKSVIGENELEEESDALKKIFTPFFAGYLFTFHFINFSIAAGTESRTLCLEFHPPVYRRHILLRSILI